MRISVVNGVYPRPYSSSRGRRKSNTEVDYNSKSTSFGGVRELLGAIFGRSEKESSKGGEIINFHEATLGRNWKRTDDINDNVKYGRYDYNDLLKNVDDALNDLNS